uniref:Acetamidase n=1 Tax=Tetradesmus obliquus TaxID=3088 RepID=A0A383V546_TETOB|eukprot:jgi/Sobl393_1/19186/SZX60725.1
MRRAVLATCWVLLGAVSVAALTALPNVCKTSVVTESGKKYRLAANASTVHWGYFFESLKPRLVIPSGSEVTVEMITHHAGDDPDKMIKGDPGVEDIYKWGASMNIPTRGASGQGDGVHVLTGPIYVCDAEPGDVLQIQILELVPRKNPRTGKAYGSNAAAWWGYQFRTPFKTGKAREVTTIYEVVEDADGAVYALPDYQFTYGNTTAYKGPLTASCVPKSGSIPDSNVKVPWAQNNKFAPNYDIPCVNGRQQFTGYAYPGVLTQHPTGTEDYSIRGKFVVPANLHIGNIGLAPKFKPAEAVNSIPPLPTGGNMDNRRIGKGATLYLPVQVAGGLLSMGDAHIAQGDSEFDGTGIETSITGRFKVTLHKKAKLPKTLRGLNFPLLENKNEWHIHGYAYGNYLTELNPPGQVFAKGASLDKAFEGVYRNARDWLMSAWDLSEDQAISLLTVACDFNVHQVVDGNWGLGVSIPKYVFRVGDKKRYKPAVICGSSTPV